MAIVVHAMRSALLFDEWHQHTRFIDKLLHSPSLIITAALRRRSKLVEVTRAQVSGVAVPVRLVRARVVGPEREI